MCVRAPSRTNLREITIVQNRAGKAEGISRSSPWFLTCRVDRSEWSVLAQVMGKKGGNNSNNLPTQFYWISARGCSYSLHFAASKSVPGGVARFICTNARGGPASLCVQKSAWSRNDQDRAVETGHARCGRGFSHTCSFVLPWRAVNLFAGKKKKKTISMDLVRVAA